jgi:hypothetical protein
LRSDSPASGASRSPRSAPRPHVTRAASAESQATADLVFAQSAINASDIDAMLDSVYVKSEQRPLNSLPPAQAFLVPKPPSLAERTPSAIECETFDFVADALF